MLKRRRITHHENLRIAGTEVWNPDIVRVPRRFHDGSTSAYSSGEEEYDMGEHIQRFVAEIFTNVLRRYRQVGARRRRLR